MQKIGIGFVAASIGLIALFTIDVIFGRSTRPATEPRTYEELPPDENPVVVIDRPPADVLDPIVREDVLQADERRAKLAGRDYTYTIVEGDTVDDLAHKYLGDHTLKSVLYDFNSHLVRGDKLRAGDKVLIPFSYGR